MTVINVMRFNEKEGGMVADSQSSTQLRKYDLADKIVPFTSDHNTTILAGGTGVSDFLYGASETLKNHLLQEKSYTVAECAETLSKIMIQFKRKKIETQLISTFGISVQEAILGENIDQNYKPDIHKMLTGQSELFQGAYLLIGKDDTGVSIYKVGIGGSPFLSARQYESVGSGQDESDKVLYKFASKKKRKERKNINLLEGMIALIKATNASSDINQGVGGVPMISYFDENGISNLEEDESKLATEIIRVMDTGLITQKQSYKALDCLLHDKCEFKEVEEKIFNQNKKYKEINRFLRGYKD